MSSMNNVVSLEDIFHKRVFRVPDYQRGYSWEKQQVQELLEDLELLEPDRFHYTGTVVLHESGSGHRMDEDGNSYAPVEIVDGQQRLTTIVLLLDGIRRALAQFSQSQTLQRGIKKKYIATKAQDGQELPKISLNEDTDHFFKEVILSDQPSVEGAKITSEQRLCTAKKQITIYLRGKEEEWLQDLFRKLTNQLRFTLYRVGDDAEVGIIFEVMNGRGKPLTELEKVKNYLLHASSSLHRSDQPNELAESINKAWAEILRQLMAADLVSSADEDRLLRAHWLTHYNPQARQWEGSKSVKERFSLRRYKERPALLKCLRSYTEGLRASCVSFCDAYQPNRDGSFASFKTNPGDRKQAIEWSSRLVRIGVVVTFLPLLLAVRKRWPNNPDKYLEILKLCEPFAFRVYKWRRYRSDAGQAALFRLGYELSKEECEFPKAVYVVKSELSRLCGNDNFVELTSSEEPTDWYNWPGLRYFLYEYEITLASQRDASSIVDWKDLGDHDPQNTIEHILPQSIEGQRYWQLKFEPKEHELYVHDLGNLTLTKHNSHYLNKPFPEKRGGADAKGYCYAKSPLYLERDLTRWEHWDASAINKRRSELLKWARNRWAVDLSDLEGDERELETAEDQLDENGDES